MVRVNTASNENTPLIEYQTFCMVAPRDSACPETNLDDTRIADSRVVGATARAETDMSTRHYGFDYRIICDKVKQH